MNKLIIILISILVITIAIITGITTYIIQTQTPKQEIQNIKIGQTVTDECVDEWEEMQKEKNSINANTSEEKLSPNCSFIFKRHYSLCNHTSKEYINIPEDMVNKTEQELQEKYSDWQIEKFTSNEVSLLKNLEGECGEHYVLRNVNNNIVVFKIINGVEQEYEKTEISVEYLTETDRITIQNGLKVFGKQSLNQIIEDFEKKNNPLI